MKFKVFAMSLAIASLAACAKHNPNTDNSGAVQADLGKHFSAVDSTYDPKNATLANKIEGIGLDFTGKPDRIMGRVLVTGEKAPVYFFSDVLKDGDLKAGAKIDITVDQLSDDNTIGGQLTGTFTCFDDACKKAGVYFRFYQGAGFIFQQVQDGSYKLVESIGKTLPLDQALAKRGLAAK